MKTEYEAKFVAIDIDMMRETLRLHGAVLEQPMRLMRRVVIDSPAMKAKDGFLRIRDEGHRVTVTYKQFDNLSVDGAKEHEITVSDFDEAIALLNAAGLPHGSYQETRRETWRIGSVEVVIDEWPWLQPYIEIEGQDETSVRDTAKTLGFNWDDAVFGDVMAAYRVQYPHLSETDTVGNIPRVVFDDPLPDLLKDPHGTTTT